MTPALPSLHRVPWGEFPDFNGTMECSDSQPSIPRHFVSFARRYRRVPTVRSRARGVHTRTGLGFGHPVSLTGSSLVIDGDDWASRVPVQPQYVHALLSDPGGTSTPGPDFL